MLAAALATTLASCSNPLETQLMGVWVLDKYEIINLDSICKARADHDIEATNKAIELVKHELDSAKVAAKRKELKDYEATLKAKLETYTPQMYKDEYTAIANDQIGELTITFDEEKKIHVHAAGSDEKQSGTWRVGGDTVYTFFDNQPAEILIVKDVSANKLQLFSPALDEHSVDLVMKFDKK